MRSQNSQGTDAMTSTPPSADESGLAPQRVVCAAIRNSSGQIICSARHFDALMHAQIAEQLHGGWKFAEQGFIDQFGQFLTREEAHLIATLRGQFFRRFEGSERTLYSENLY